MGTVVTIIIVIISIVLRALGENAKPKNTPRPSSPTPTAQPVNTLDEILRRMREQQAAAQQQTQEAETQQVKPTYQPEPVRQAPQQAAVHNQYVEAYQSPAMQPQQYNLPPEGVHAIAKHQPLQVQDLPDDGAPDFDIRQAVIYSAILNRPNY